MSELRQKARHYQKRASELRRRVSKLRKARDRLESSLRHLNWQYEFGSIDYSTYSKLFDEYLNFRTVEEYEAWFDGEERRLLKKLSYYESKLEAVRARQQAATRTVAASASLIIMLALMIGATVHLNMLPAEQIVTGMSAGIDKITGFASATSTIGANATIEVYYAVASSPDLADGIDFGTLQHNTTDNNATENFNASSMTNLYLELSPDSNVNADICIKANDDLINGTNILGIGNMTFSNATVNNATLPALETSIALSKTEWVNATRNLGAGSTAFFRFYLDVPDAQRPGRYNNTLQFNIVQTGTDCSLG